MWLNLLLLSINVIQTPVVCAFLNGGSTGNTMNKNDKVKENFPSNSDYGRTVYICEGNPMAVQPSLLNILQSDSQACPCRLSPAPETTRICSGSESEVAIGTLVCLNFGCYFKVGNQYLASQDFCLNSLTEARVCKEKIVVRKCCNVAETFNSSKWKCQRGENSYFPEVSIIAKIPQIPNGYPQSEQLLLSFRIQPLNKSLRQGKKSMNSERSIDVFYLNEDGVYHEPPGIFLRGVRKKFTGEYCLERNEDENGNDVLLVYDMTDELQTRNMAEAMGILWLFSVPFAVVTALAHVLVLQRNIHGFALAGYLITTSVQNIFASVLVFNFRSEAVGVFGDSCTLVDFTQKILYCSNVCWMTVINFDLWITFRKLNSIPDGNNNFFRFPFYALFALALPCAIVFIDWIIGRQLAPSDFCVLYETPSLICFSIPILILIVVNATFFVCTSLNIRQHCQSTEDILKTSNRISRKSFAIFAKLFLMTGSFWVIRIILLFLHFTSNYLTVVAVILEAIFITPEILFFFLVFTSRATWVKLQQKFPILEFCCCCSGKNCPPKSSGSNSSNEVTSTQLDFRKYQSSISVESVTSQGSIESYI